MKKMCNICPFGKSPKAIEQWGERACDDIHECAEILWDDDGQTTPHPCFKFSLRKFGTVPLRTCKPGEPVCVGHQQWLEVKFSLEAEKSIC